MTTAHSNPQDAFVENCRKYFLMGRWVVLILIAVVLIPHELHAEQMTLNQVLALAYTNNPQLEAQRASLRATDQGVAKALAGWRPTLGAGGSYGWQQRSQTFGGNKLLDSRPESEQLTFSQPIFNGRTLPSIRQAKATVDLGRAQLLATEQSVLLEATAAYLDVLRDTQIVNAYHHDIEQLRAISRNSEERLRLGELTKTDSAQAAARLMGSEINLTAAEQQLATSRAKFQHVIGSPAGDLKAPDDPKIPGSQEEAMRAARSANPLILQNRAQAKVADSAVELAYGALLPSLSLQAQYGRTKDQVAPGVSQNGASIVGQLTIPIYQGGAEEAAVRQAKEQRTQAHFGIVEAERQTEEDVVTSWSAVITSAVAAEIAIRQEGANTIAFEGAKMESQVGARSVIDILNADQELLQSHVTSFLQQDAALISKFRLRAAIGLMTSSALKLPVTTYDPQANYDQNATKWFGFGE
jgi:outer membrane protein